MFILPAIDLLHSFLEKREFKLNLITVLQFHPQGDGDTNVGPSARCTAGGRPLDRDSKALAGGS